MRRMWSFLKSVSSPMWRTWDILSTVSGVVGIWQLIKGFRLGRQERDRDTEFGYFLERIAELETQVLQASRERQAERTGRIRAQQAQRQQLLDQVREERGAYPLTPIGYLRSCFSARNGTPRQPLLVPLARARLELAPGGVSPIALEGLEQYSHCWLIYVFHCNTDIERIWKPSPNRSCHAKVRVPRLQGGKMGVLATRSPHRPMPIGLSIAKIEGVKDGALVLSGADVVDGTPVLDVKPYLPFCDSVPNAVAPPWVVADAEDEPLRMNSVELTPRFVEALENCWQSMGSSSLYEKSEDLVELIRQVLAREIRSICQRQAPHASPAFIRTPSLTEVPTRSGSESWDGPGGDETEGGGKSWLVQNSSGVVEASEGDGSIAVGGTRVGTGEEVEYHLLVEGLDVMYTIHEGVNVCVEHVSLRRDV